MDLHREGIGELEQQKHKAQRRKLNDAARPHKLQQAEKPAVIELPEDQSSAGFDLQEEKRLPPSYFLAAIELQREKTEELERRERQRKLDEATRRLELQRAKEELAAVRAEKSRLASLAMVEQAQELWR
jgi:hypothetical protein